MATLKDVAKRAGVSIATVSYYVNDSHSIKASTAAKVAQAIEDLNYIPNSQARNLKRRISREICVILPTLENLCYNEFLKGILLEAEGAGYSVNTSCSYNDISKEQELIRNAVSKNYAGILLVTCQPQNTDFFQEMIRRHSLQFVFLDQLPNKVDAIYFGFDNYDTMHSLTASLINRGYREIALLTGPDNFFSESECIAGYQDAMDQASISIPVNGQICCDNTKEGAFHAFLQNWTQKPPQAIITSSQAICQGVIEACNLIQLQIPSEICIITLDVDNWNRSSFYPNIIRTTRPAHLLGAQSCQALLQAAQKSDHPENRFHILHDTITDYPISLPLPRKTLPFISKTPSEVLRVAAADLPTIRAIQSLSPDFYARYQIRLQIEIMEMKDLFSCILEDSKREHPSFDLYLYDTSWFHYLMCSDCLKDLTEDFYEIPEHRRYFVPKNLHNCEQKNRFYGFPIIGGTQFLLYRKDLFSNRDIAMQYRQDHKISLRPPKTWKEFNSIARFFSRKYNPSSPTRYGTAMASELNEELALEFEPRMWSFGGGFYDSKGKIQMNTPQNASAIKNFMESMQYSQDGLSSNQDVFSSFAEGHVAMVITFTEYATQLQNDSHAEYLHRNGYGMIPGQIAANVGWHFGVPHECPHLDRSLRFFSWLYQRHTSYYLSIIGGSSALVFPYRNHELQKMYPWINLTSESVEHSRSRIYPIQRETGLLAPNEFEKILCNELRTRPQTSKEIADCLNRMQTEMHKIL